MIFSNCFRLIWMRLPFRITQPAVGFSSESRRSLFSPIRKIFGRFLNGKRVFFPNRHIVITHNKAPFLFKTKVVFVKVGRKERTAAGTAPRESHPRVVLTRPCSLPATLQTLGLRRQGSIIVLSARRRPQAATPALRPGKIAPLIPMGKASWRTCRPARHRQNVSVCPMTRRHCPAGVFVKEQRGRRENRQAGKGKAACLWPGP